MEGGVKTAASLPSAGAMVAAAKWIEPTEGNRLHEESAVELAALIDAETRAPELRRALAGMLDAFAWRWREAVARDGMDALQSDVRRAVEALNLP